MERLFKNAQIIGCDILESVLFLEERISTYVLDQSNEESLKKLKLEINKKIDIIIDDGSHIQEHMINSFYHLWEKININGFYIIEDVNTSFLKRIMELNEEFEFHDALCVKCYKGKNIADNFIAFKKIRTFENRKEMIKHYCKKFSSPKVLEIGVFKGDFLDHIVNECNISQIDAVDLFQGETCSGDADGNNVIYCHLEDSYIELKEKYKDNKKVQLYKSDSKKFLENQENNTYDIIYIDGDHSYNGVLSDLQNAFMKIKDGGYIMGHDYEMNWEKAKNKYDFGVKAAVNEFCMNYKQNILTKALDGCVSFCIQINKQ